jgi:hypothetical protein
MCSHLQLWFYLTYTLQTKGEAVHTICSTVIFPGIKYKRVVKILYDYWRGKLENEVLNTTAGIRMHDFGTLETCGIEGASCVRLR